MSRVLLFECGPRRVSDGVVVTQRFCFKAPGAANFLGLQWEPVVIEPPVFGEGIGFDGRNFAASPEPQNGELVFALTDTTRAAAGLVWKNAAVTIRMAPWPAGGGNPADGAFSTIWTGLADECTAGPGIATVTLLDAGQVLRDPAIVTKFGSAGDTLLDSADAVRDRPANSVVPRAWGRVLSIPGLLVDRANGIYLFANSVATSVEGFYDGGAAFTLGVARASLAALQSNVPAAGAVDYCLNSAGKLLARPWDTPNFPFTADATFGNTRAADIATAIVASRSALAFRAGVVAAFNTLQAAPCGIYVDDDTSLAVLLDRLFSGLGAFWRLTSAGTIDIQRAGFAGSPALTVGIFRGRPARQRIIVPTGRRSIGYARNWRTHTESEIAAILLVEAGSPVLSQLSPTTGNAKPSFASSDGVPFSRVVASGEVSDGGTVTFPTVLSSVPNVSFLYGGAGVASNSNIRLEASSLSTSGFTAILKAQVVTPGSLITDGSSTGGTGGEPQRVINRTNSGAPFDGRFTFQFDVEVGEFAPGEPGTIRIGIYVKKSGSWVSVGTSVKSASGVHEFTATPGTVDFGAGNEFGITQLSATGPGTTLNSFNSVRYRLGSVTETSLTPTGASPIKWEARL